MTGSKKKAKGVPTDAEVLESGGSKCYAQNLSIAYLFSCLNQKVDDSRYPEAERTVNYLTSEFILHLEHILKLKLIFPSIPPPPVETVPFLCSASSDTSAALIKVLRSVLLRNGAEWTRAKVSTKKLLSTTIECYQKQKFAKEVRTKALVLLCDIVLDVHLCARYG